MSEAIRSNAPANGWKTDTLGAICRSGGGSIQTGPFGSQLHAEDYKEDGTPIITVEHLKEGKIAHENLPLVGKEDCRRLQRYKLNTGDLVFSRVGAIDRCAYVLEAENGWLFSGRCLRVRAGNGEADSRFLSYLLNSFNQRQWILNHSVGSTMACLNTAILSGVPISHPPLPQQRKIARILKTVDNLIEKTEALIAKYQAIKQGMMHDLFTRGVDEHGHLRPPYEEAPELYKQSELGWIPKEWEVGSIENYLMQPGGMKPGPFGSSLTKDVYTNAGYRVYGQEQILAGTLSEGDYYVSALKYAELRDFAVVDNDVLMTLVGVGTVGKVLIVRKPFEPGIINPRVIRFRVDRTKCDIEFFKHFIPAPLIRRQFNLFATGGTMPVLNLSVIRKVSVPVIPLHEQRSVAEKLDSLDRHVAREQRTLVKRVSFKIGLMQDLLTGKVRVKVDEAEEVTAHA